MHAVSFHVKMRLEVIKHYYGEETDKDRASGIRGMKKKTGNWECCCCVWWRSPHPQSVKLLRTNLGLKAEEKQKTTKMMMSSIVEAL